MNKVYNWHETTTGWLMRVNGKDRWFIKEIKRGPERGGSYYELMEYSRDSMGREGWLLRDIVYNGLNGAKHRAYLIECQEYNGRRDMVKEGA